MTYSREAIMMAMIAADVSEEKANDVMLYLEEAQKRVSNENTSGQYKRWLLSVGSYQAMERKANEFSEQDIIY